MLRTFTAREFIQPAARGGNLPMLIRGRTDAGEDASIYLKTRAGYGDRPAAPGVELFTTLLAREIGVLAPEPVLVQVPARFHEQVFDQPKHRKLLEESAGLNFGTVSFGADWKTWPVGMSVRAFTPELIEAILIFDGIVQQADRAADNPNLLWRGHQIAVIDHEKCFGYLGLATDVQRPWREFFSRGALHTHCLLPVGKNLMQEGFGKAMWENLLGLEFDERVPELAGEVLGAFPEAELEIGRISAYLNLLFRNIEDFLTYLKHAITR